MVAQKLKRMLISPKISIILFSLIVLVLIQLGCIQQKMKSDVKTNTDYYANLIASLGLERKDQLPILKILATDPRVSVGLLIDSLHVISDPSRAGFEDYRGMIHVVCIIGALSYLTGGMEFCSKSTYIFDTTDDEHNREHFLKMKHGDCMTFYAIWPSRGNEYIAPVDVQESIIQQWKDWYLKNGKDFKYIPLSDSAFSDPRD